MSSEVSLQKLVKALVAKKTSPRAFLGLLKQLLQNSPVSDHELAESLVELRNHKECVEYALEYAVSGTAELQRFMKVLSSVSFSSQKVYLVYLKNKHTQVFKGGLTKEFVGALVSYSSSIASQMLEVPTWGADHVSVWNHLVLLWGSVIDVHSDLVPPAPFKELAMVIMSVFVKHGGGGMAAFFTRKANVVINSADLSKELQAVTAVSAATKTENVAVANARKSYAFNVHSRKGAAYLQLKKFVWLNRQLQQWRTEGLAEAYLQYFGIPTHSAAELIEELVGVFFAGVSTAIILEELPYVVFNWKNYVVSRLPLFLRDCKAISGNTATGSERSVGELLVAAVTRHSHPTLHQITVGGWSQPYDLRKQFLRSCIYRGMVSLAIYTRQFPDEADSLLALLIVHETEQLSHVDSLGAELNTKLLHVNTEFTSLEESRLVEYMQQIPVSNVVFLEKKQTQLNRVVHRAVDALLKERSTDKLARLVVALARSPAAANHVFFGEGPWPVLGKIVAYIDREPFADDDNFQDGYAQFGLVMCGVFALARFFGIDWARIDMRDSYCGDFIHRFYFRHADDLSARADGTDGDSATIVANYNALMNNWANALFDVAHDGLSDDLVRAINVKQTYKLLAVIFQQAIMAHAIGSLSDAALHNGLDYLSQSFLVPCLLEIMLWLVSRIGPMQQHSDTMARVLLRIMETNLVPHDSNYVFKVLLGIIGPDVRGKLRSVKTETGSKLETLLDNYEDLEYAGTCGGILKEPLVAGSSVKMVLAKYMSSEGNGSGASEEAPAKSGDTWREIRSKWNRTLQPKRLRQLVDELRRCHALHVPHADAEDAKMAVDLLVLLIGDSEGAPALNPQFRSQPTFAVSIDNHYASIFSEPTPEKPAKDDLDFDMDDLFDTDDLFGDLTMQVLATPRRPCSPALGYRILTQNCSTFSYVQRMLDTDTDVGAVARMRLAQEVERCLRTKS